MFAGAEMIMAPGGRRSQSEWVTANLTAVCGAVYFFVTHQIQKLKTGEEVSRETYIPARKQILALLARARDEVDTKGAAEDDFWAGYQATKAKDFDIAVQEMTDRDCLAEDWFTSLADVVAQTDDDRHNHMDREGSEDAVARATARSADSMLQDRFDLLTDEKRADYRTWKEGILRRIEQLEANGAERMDVDT